MSNKKAYALLEIYLYEQTNVLGIYTDKSKAVKDMENMAETPFLGDYLILIAFPSIDECFSPAGESLYSGKVVNKIEFVERSIIPDMF